MATKTNPRRMYALWQEYLVRKDGVTSSGNHDGSVTRNATVTTGSNYENWKLRIKQNRNATTSLTGTEYRWNPPFFDVTAIRKNPAPPSYPGLPGTSFVLCNITGFPVVFPGASPSSAPGISASSADNLALSKFVKNAINKRRTMMSGVFLGELRQTIQLVRNPARAIRSGLDDYVSALRKKRPQLRRTSPSQRRRTATSIVSDTWLEWSFGMAPLFSDARSAAEALAKSRILPEKAKAVFVKAEGKSTTGPSNWTSLGDHTASAASVRTFASTETYHSVKYYGKVKVYHPNSLQNQLGLLPEDFVPTVWELVPWSFLVDYFTNVGNIIQAACFLRSSMAWIARGTRHASDTRLMCVPRSSFLNDFNLFGATTTGSYSVALLTRGPYTGSLIPDLEFSIPGSGTKWANLGALAASMRSLRPFHLL